MAPSTRLVGVNRQCGTFDSDLALEMHLNGCQAQRTNTPMHSICSDDTGCSNTLNVQYCGSSTSIAIARIIQVCHFVNVF